MSQSYKLVQRTSVPGDNMAEKKFYAQAVNNGITELDALCSHISARSTVSSADVKAVLDSLNYILDMELRAGRIVRIGELGSFRITVGSAGSVDAKSFTSSLLRKPKILFTPGAALNRTRSLIEFKRYTTPGGQNAENGDDNGGTTEPGDI